MTASTEATQDGKLALTERTSVVIVTYNHSDYIEECLRTVFDNNPGEVVVVDNGSTDGTVRTVELVPGGGVVQTRTILDTVVRAIKGWNGLIRSTSSY
ncbi:glycosyltransferase family 2 protein (plasmid) [Haloarcula sp. NS06]|uniref:glycosyltransferase family 2 protein n=1 Tax=Haloarcula sp. NS06 TaxID=3409688 RepID=UPI003DA6CF6B